MPQAFSITLEKFRIVAPTSVKQPRNRGPAVIQPERLFEQLDQVRVNPLPLFLKKALTRMFPNLSVKKPKFYKRGSSVIFELPHRLITSCFEPEFTISKVTDDIYSEAQAFRLVVSNKADLSSYPGGNMDQMILNCMADKGDIVAVGDKFKLKGDIRYASPERFSSKNILNGLDTTKPAQLVFGSPASPGDSIKSLSNSFCYTDQSFFDTFLISSDEAKQNNIKRVCRGKDVKELYQVIDEDKILLFSNPDIYNILRASQKEMAEKKYKKLASLAKKIEEAEDESEIKRLGRVYREEVKEFQKEFLVPLVKELGRLVELKEAVDDENKKERLEEEIVLVKEMIGFYANPDNDSDFDINSVVGKTCKGRRNKIC